MRGNQSCRFALSGPAKGLHFIALLRGFGFMIYSSLGLPGSQVGAELEELGFLLLFGTLLGVAGEHVGRVTTVLVEFLDSLLNEGAQLGQQVNFLAAGASAVGVLGVEGVAHVGAEVQQVLVADALGGGGVDDVLLLGDAGLHGGDVGSQLSLDVHQEGDHVLHAVLAALEVGNRGVLDVGDLSQRGLELLAEVAEELADSGDVVGGDVAVLGCFSKHSEDGSVLGGVAGLGGLQEHVVEVASHLDEGGL